MGRRMKRLLVAIAAMMIAGAAQAPAAETGAATAQPATQATAIFAGGCFWCGSRLPF